METKIKKQFKFSANEKNYKSYTINSGKKLINIIVVNRNNKEIDNIQVRVSNDFNKLWRGFSKDFETYQQAYDYFKEKEIKAAIRYIELFYDDISILN